MQSIETKYIGPTNSRGSRIKATASGGYSITLTWDDALNTDENHNAAARALIRKLGWYHGLRKPSRAARMVEAGDAYGDWYFGGRKDGSHVYVCTVSYAKLNMEVK